MYMAATRVVFPRRQDRGVVNADDGADGKVAFHQGGAVERIRGDVIFFMALADGDNGLPFFRRVFAHETGKLELGLENFIGAPVEGQLILSENVLKPGEFPV